MPRLLLIASACLASTCLTLGSAALAQSPQAPQATPQSAPQWIAEMADASKLPRIAGAQELFASTSTTMLVVRDKVPEVVAATRALLVADGWQPADNASTQGSGNDALAIMNFRKGSQALNVFIGVAPAQGGATTIQYTPIDPGSLPKTQARRETPAPAPTQPARPVTETAMVDVAALPRLPGAYLKDEQARRNDAHSVSYMVPDTLANTRAAFIRLLGADGWVAYAAPLERASPHSLHMKKGGQGLSVFFTFDGSNTTRSGVSLSSERIYANVPFPPGATDVVYDYNRPLMDAIAPGPMADVLAFFRSELAALGWHEWSAEDQARYPNAKIEPAPPDEARVTFARDPRDRRDPIQVSLGQRKDGRVDVEVRVPAFARPQELKAGEPTMGLPKPERIKSATGRDGQTQRELTATVPAERDVVLAFYRGELARMGWREDARGPVTRDDEIVLDFTAADGKSAALRLGFVYDLTTVTLTQQLPDKVAQARARAKQEAEDALRRRVEDLQNPPKVVAALPSADAPIPVPEDAEKLNFDAARGDVKFTSPSRVREIAAFYRKALAPLGFRENPTPIDDERMAALDFTRGGKRLYVSILRVGERTDVRGYGPGLAALAGDARAQQAMKAAAGPAQPALEELEAEPTDGLPVPKKVTMSFASGTPFGREREATVTASLDSTLAFYRGELARLGWKEESKGAVIKPNEVRLAFTTPDGSGTLVLGREDGKTTVKLTQRMPEAAARKGMVAKPGMGLLLLGSALETEAVVTIGRQTIKVAPGTGRQDSGPRLDLKPGTYKASVKVPGKAPFTEEVKIASGQTMGLLIGPAGVLPLPLN
jgi:hypothetical protein